MLVVKFVENYREVDWYRVIKLTHQGNRRDRTNLRRLGPILDDTITYGECEPKCMPHNLASLPAVKTLSIDDFGAILKILSSGLT